MNKIPTAEEFVKYFRKQNPPAKFQTIESWMGEFCIEYAKLHVKAAVRAAIENYKADIDEFGNVTGYKDVIEKSILNAYPENLIV